MSGSNKLIQSSLVKASQSTLAKALLNANAEAIKLSKKK